jgi:ferredoxin-like protein FixX
MCAPNSVGINGQQGCSVCPAGKFKSGYGNGVCETTGRSCVNPCGQGNFKNNDVCTVCPANTYKYWGGTVNHVFHAGTEHMLVVQGLRPVSVLLQNVQPEKKQSLPVDKNIV